MGKVEESERQQVLEWVIDYGIIKEIQRKHTERETTYIDIYVQCYPWSSWEELAEVLYKYHHVAAVEEVRSYLPPRGKPGFDCLLHVQ